MKTYRVIASETIYAEYYTEIKAKDKKQVVKMLNESKAELTSWFFWLIY